MNDAHDSDADSHVAMTMQPIRYNTRISRRIRSTGHQTRIASRTTTVATARTTVPQTGQSDHRGTISYSEIRYLEAYPNNPAALRAVRAQAK